MICSFLRKYRFSFLAVIIILAIWYGLSLFFADGLIPWPHLVAADALNILVSRDFLVNLTITLTRIVIGLSLSLLLSLIAGWLIFRYRRAGLLVEPGTFVGLTIPSTVMAFIVIILLGNREIALITTIIVVCTPQLVVIISAAVSTLDRNLTEMGRIFRISPFSELRHIILPQLMPALLAAVKTGISVSWKTAMIAETFAFSSGIGYQIYYQFVMFSLKGVLAWTLAFLLVMSLINSIVNYLEKRSFIWKTQN